MLLLCGLGGLGGNGVLFPRSKKVEIGP